MTPFYLLFTREAIVVARWYVHCELSRAPARRHGLRDAADVVDGDDALDLFLVDVEDGVVGDGDHSLLRPLKHVDFLHQRGVYKSVSSDELHEGAISAEIDVVFLGGESYGSWICLNHFVSLCERLYVLLLSLFSIIYIRVPGLIMILSQ